jgi:hypothetical protein
MRSPWKQPTSVTFLLLSLVLLLSGGCETFTPRNAPPPCDPDSDPDCRAPAIFVDPTSPQAVVSNIISAIEAFTVKPNYEESLSSKGNDEPPFEYIPDPGLNEVFPGFFDGWQEEREVQFMLDLLVSAGRPIRVDFNVTLVREIDHPAGNTNQVRYDVEYDLTLTFRDSEQDPPVDTDRQYCASALWDFFGGDRNEWVLNRWEEISPSGDPDCLGSMGLLRATTGQGL